MRIQYGYALTALLLLTGTVAGCASPDDGPGGDPFGAGVTGADEGLRATCGVVTFDTIPADWSAFAPLELAEGEIDLERVGGEREFFDGYDWHVAEQTSDRLTLFGVAREAPGVQPADGLSYADATFERDADRWVPQSWGQCRIEVATEGWGNARFVLDPDAAPDPAATTVSVLAWEMACASGQPPGDRQVDPVVLTADDQSVSIVVLVEPVTGGADCPSNPSFPLEIDLGGPLGDRTILDASSTPPHQRPWPPTQSSLDSQGLTE